MDTLSKLKTDLEAARGHWRRIAKEAQVDVSIISRIVRGVTENPTIKNVDALRNWLEANPPPYIVVSAAADAATRKRSRSAH